MTRDDDLPDGLPVLPYGDSDTGRSSGWSGSDTSRARAHRNDADGTTADWQMTMLRLLARAGTEGRTWYEISEILGHPGQEHGSITGALSDLHKEGRINRLTGQRNRCKVYVLPVYREGRDIEPQGRNTSLQRLKTLREYLQGQEETHSFVEISEVWRIIGRK